MLKSASQFEPTTDLSLGNELRLVTRAITSRMKLIAAVAALAALLGIAYLWSAELQYSSTAEILIDPRSKQLLERQVAPTGLGSSSLGPDTILLDSQIEVIHSSLVLDKVIEKHRLFDDPNYGKTAPKSNMSPIRDTIRWLLRGPQSVSIPDEVPQDRALRMLKQSLRVERKNSTYVVAITVRSNDRFKAAEIANSISSTYVDESNAAANAVTTEASKSLTERLQKLQKEAADADRKVEEYRARTGLTGDVGNDLVEQQLKELTTLLTTAKVAVQEEESLWQEVSQLSSNDINQISNAARLQPQVLTELLQQLTSAESREVAVKAVYLPKHPLAQAAAKQRAIIAKAISAEIKGIKKRQRAKLDSALREQSEIESKLKDLEAQSTELRMASLELNKLVADSVSRKDLLNTFENSARQAEEQVGLPASTIRVIARATPASRPASASPATILAASIVLGTLIGTMLAWLSHLLNGTKPKIKRWSA